MHLHQADMICRGSCTTRSRQKSVVSNESVLLFFGFGLGEGDAGKVELKRGLGALGLGPWELEAVSQWEWVRVIQAIQSLPFPVGAFLCKVHRAETQNPPANKSSFQSAGFGGSKWLASCHGLWSGSHLWVYTTKSHLQTFPARKFQA